ncbi:hypothetical protein [Flavobacterium sp. TAB 87]|uniref:hypothetical protein n=1 Tax=Flavobacterium sp. TAB 87 TaxID=1729581 RepID=UPI00076D1201|nr:hypothetical protein [Flavobacterium sp. TAB 87]KVV13547.1 hypothetical protein AP058_02912 [Flavobacterium sp. TAB 87]
MKIIPLLFLTFLMQLGCASHKTDILKDVTIEYSAVSRGLYQNISVENKSAVILNARAEQPLVLEISDKDWKAIASEFEKINVPAIANVKAPTEKRFYDGAAIANLKITKEGKTYETPAFDHGFPPAEIEKLVNLLVALNKN